MILNENDLQDFIEDAQNNTIEPMVYKLSIGRKIQTYENTLPTHRNIYDMAKWKYMNYIAK